MTKKELLDRVYRAHSLRRAGLTKKQTRLIVDALFDELSDYFIKNRRKRKKPRFSIHRIGTLMCIVRKPRIIRYPLGSTRYVEIPTHLTLVFRVASELKRRMNDHAAMLDMAHDERNHCE